MKRAVSLQKMLPLIIGPYAAALLLLLVHAVRVRKQAAWQRDAEVQKSRRLLQKELEAAAKEAARDAAPRLCAALRALRKELALPAEEGQALLQRLETEAYSQNAVNQPLPQALRDEVAALAATWSRVSQRPLSRSGPEAGRAALGLLVLWGLGAGHAQAQDSTVAQKLKRSRAAYQAALAESDRDRRRSGFAEVEATLRELCAAYPDRPQLLTDWGNAALLAQEPGRAVLAYRRALRLEPELLRARRNLSFLRDRLPDWLPRSRPSGALESFLFWNQAWPMPMRQVGLALAVFFAVALLIPWSRRRRWLRLLAALPLVFASTLALSLGVERDASRDAVVITPGILRSADSLGAPPALGHPLPAGAEVSVSENRGDFTRIVLANGQTGWLPTSALETI